MECCVLVLKWQQVLVYIGFRYSFFFSPSLVGVSVIFFPNSSQFYLFIFYFPSYCSNVQSSIVYADISCC